MMLIKVLWQHRKLVGIEFVGAQFLAIFYGFIELLAVSCLALMVTTDTATGLKSFLALINLADTELLTISIFFLSAAIARLFIVVVFTRVQVSLCNGMVMRVRYGLMKSYAMSNNINDTQGDISNLIIRESEKVGEAFTYILELMKRFILVTVYLIASSVINLTSTAIFLFFLIIMMFLYKRYNGRIYRQSSNLLEISEVITNMTIDILKIKKTLRIVNDKTGILAQYEKKLLESYKSQFFLDFFNRLVKLIPEILGLIIIAATAVISEVSETVDFTSVLVVLVLMQRMLSMLSAMQFQIVKLSIVSVPVIKIFKNIPISLHQSFKKQNDQVSSILLSFNDARVGIYVMNTEILLEKNTSYLINGPSGSGKTSLIDLLLHDVKLENFKATLNGNKTYFDDFGNPKPRISLMSQENGLLEGTISDNISLFLPKDYKKLQRAAYISQIPNKLMDNDPLISDAKLSGGQLQRICLARAIYEDCDVLILDEPTSSLDASTEIEFFKHIKNLKKEKILIVVSHNKEAVRYFDKVIEISALGSSL